MGESEPDLQVCDWRELGLRPCPRAQLEASTGPALCRAWLTDFPVPKARLRVPFWQRPPSRCRAPAAPRQQRRLRPPRLKLPGGSSRARSGSRQPRFLAEGEYTIVLPVIFFAEKTGAGFEQGGTGTCREAHAGCCRQSRGVPASSRIPASSDHGASSKGLLLRPGKDLRR